VLVSKWGHRAAGKLEMVSAGDSSKVLVAVTNAHYCRRDRINLRCLDIRFDHAVGVYSLQSCRMAIEGMMLEKSRKSGAVSLRHVRWGAGEAGSHRHRSVAANQNHAEEDTLSCSN